MKRLNTLEICGLVLGIVFLIYGVSNLIWPKPGVVSHFTNDELGMSPGYKTMTVSATGSRIYGLLAATMGAGMVAAALCREKK